MRAREYLSPPTIDHGVENSNEARPGRGGGFMATCDKGSVSREGKRQRGGSGAGVAFAAEYLDQSFQSAEDVQLALEIPVLGSISTIVTEADLNTRRRNRRGWVTFRKQINLLRNYILRPAWSRIDSALQKRGL